MEYQSLKHTFEPVFDAESRILILGSFPSVKSRANNFFYGHPQNRFWKVMASVLDWNVPVTIDEKKKMEYEMILGLRKLEGVSTYEFKLKYGKEIEECYDIKEVLENGYLIKENGYLKIPEKYLYISNDILVHFV